jgi:hypothetical protein
MRYLFLLIKISLLSVVLSVVVGGCYLFFLRASIPSAWRYQSSDAKQADKLARSIQGKLHRERWLNTGAIRWSILNNDYLWDLERGLVRARFEDYQVLFHVEMKRYAVKQKPREGMNAGRWVKILGSEAREIATKAYELWLRDRFILEPSQSLFDPHVERYAVDIDSKHPSLLVHYPKGGPQPRSTYHWELKDHMPTGIRVWSKDLPFSGFLMEMDGWRILDTGLKVSLMRSVGPFHLEIKAKAATSLSTFVGDRDPFQEIKGDPFEPMPTSQPNTMDKAARTAELLR